MRTLLKSQLNMMPIRLLRRDASMLMTVVLILTTMMTAIAAAAGPVLPSVRADRSYAVVVSRETAAKEGWKEVVRALRDKYDASLLIYPSGRVTDALPHLKELHPRYAAFVAVPEEAGRHFVVSVHRLTRKLDDDPYTDLRWGIVTGYEAADALRIAKRRKPLVIGSAASSMGPGCFKSLDHGFASSETDPSKFWIKCKGTDIEEKKVAPDPVKALVDAFNSQSPDMFITSGHATERDWQVIYNRNMGSFRCRDGQLYGLNSQRKTFDINSPGTKIYLPMGNCLIGHVPDRNCMALAWMHTGGVCQMFGYTTVTFHGYMGWGIGNYFNNQYTLSEAFYFNNQSLIWELQKDFPDKANVEFDRFDHRSINQMVRKHQLRDRKLIGHLWDRDSVAFYGDPAWEAHQSVDDPAWKVRWEHKDDAVAITVAVLRDGTWGKRPLAVPFPTRLTRIQDVECSHGLEPLVTDDFALLPLMEKERKAGETITLTFGGAAVESHSTSARSEPLNSEHERK